MPLVSVIIPTCNGKARFVDQALASVEAQTFQDFELIIVDDASTDGTLEYVQELIPAHRRVIYHRRETNGGPAVARNDGVRQAKGEFLAFLDQDDLWDPTFLEETCQIIQSHEDRALIHTDGYTINISHDILQYNNNMRHAKELCLLLTKGHVMIGDGCLIRKTHFDAVNGYDAKLRIWEDRDLYIRLLQKYHVCHLPKPLYRNRRYTHSACAATSKEQAFLSRQYFLQKHAPSCQEDTDLKEALQFERSCLYSDMGKYYLSQNQRRKAHRFFLQSLKFAPFSRMSRRTILRYLRSLCSFFPINKFFQSF